MIALYIVCGVLIVLAGLFLFAIFPALSRNPDKTLLTGARIAHRGLHDEKAGIPENSLAAFALAVKNGYWIENDIHLTADGHVVVFHDDTLERMCGVSGRPEDMSLAELKSLRLSGTSQQIPTLEECLETVSGKVPLLIEFKCASGIPAARLCEAAQRILRTYNGKYLIQSFYPQVLFWYRRHESGICRGQLATAFHGEALHKRLAGCLLFNFWGRPHFVSYEHKFAKQPFRRFCSFLGAIPVGWTFHSQEEIEAVKTAFLAYIFEGFRAE